MVATSNPGKLLELRALLGDLQAALITPDEMGLEITVVEDGRDYVDNALKKARVYCAASGLISLADDSGLEVDALDGAPGLHSKRYLPAANASDADRRAFLLHNLSNKPRPWRARFRAAVAVAVPGGRTHWTEGECPGEIIPDERGSNGFGYDPVFLVEGTGLTMAELDLPRKNELSHRGRATSGALPMLREILGEKPRAG
jgi:XTP/dITP diphosphohydrolase